VGRSFLPPAGCGFLFAFPDAIAFALNQGHVGMMQETIEKSGNTGSVGKDLVPFFEGTIGSYDQGLAFVAAVDDFIQQVRGFVIEG
jgi:hypothetical protein